MQGLPYLPIVAQCWNENQKVHMRLYKGRDIRMNKQRKVDYWIPCSSFIFLIINHSSFVTWSRKTFSASEPGSAWRARKHTESIDAFPRNERDDLVLESEARHQRPGKIRQKEVTDCLPNIFAVSQGALSILTAIPPPTAVFLTRSTDLCSFSRLVLTDELIIQAKPTEELTSFQA